MILIQSKNHKCKYCYSNLIITKHNNLYAYSRRNLLGKSVVNITNNHVKKNHYGYSINLDLIKNGISFSDYKHYKHHAFGENFTGYSMICNKCDYSYILVDLKFKDIYIKIK